MTAAATPGAPEPLVAVVIPALNEAGKIGKVLDRLPRDGRFEAIVVDDGSTDTTGDEARAHGAAVVLCDEKHLPAGLLLGMADNRLHTRRLAAQVAAKAPLKKQLPRRN